MAFQFALSIAVLTPVVALDDAWVTYWRDTDCRSYVGQDESDARAKYYSVSKDDAKILVNNNDAALTYGTDEWVKVLYGCALDDGHLSYPSSSSSYNVVWSENENDNHEFQTDNGADAGAKYQAEVDAKKAVAMFDGSGSVSKQFGSADPLRNLKGYYWKQSHTIEGNDMGNTTVVV